MSSQSSKFLKFGIAMVVILLALGYLAFYVIAPQKVMKAVNHAMSQVLGH